MHVWQLQEAKAKLTQLINDALLENQMISRHGVNEVVVMSIKKYEQLVGPQEDIVTFFNKSPLKGVELDLDRDKTRMRVVRL